MNKAKIFFIFSCFIFVQTTIAFAGMALEHMLLQRDEGAVINQTEWDVIVAVINKVVNQNTTNGNPPIVELEIEECLRGNLKPGFYTAIWQPFPHSIDWEGADVEKFIEDWKAQPLNGPMEKVKMILVGKFDKENNRFMISSIGHFEYTESRKKWALENIEKGKKVNHRWK